MLIRPIETLDLIEFRLAKAGDIDGLVDLLQLFFADSTYPSFGLSFDGRRLHDWLDRAIHSGRQPHFIALDSHTGKVVGSVAYTIQHSFSDKPIAEMGRFYVREAWRRSAIGRVLLSLAMDAAKADGAALFHVFINSGIPGSVNVFRKFGFRETPHSTLLGKEL